MSVRWLDVLGCGLGVPSLAECGLGRVIRWLHTLAHALGGRACSGRLTDSEIWPREKGRKKGREKKRKERKGKSEGREKERGKRK